MLYTIFQSYVYDFINQYAPIKMFSQRNVPWFTPTLRRLVRSKQSKYNEYENNPNNRNFTEYKLSGKFSQKKLIRNNFSTIIIVEQNALNFLPICSIAINLLLLTQKKKNRYHPETVLF